MVFVFGYREPYSVRNNRAETRLQCRRKLPFIVGCFPYGYYGLKKKFTLYSEDIYRFFFLELRAIHLVCKRGRHSYKADHF